MHIGLVCDSYPPQMGGLERHVHDIAQGLTGSGVEVTVFTTYVEGRADSGERVMGMHRLAGPAAGYSFWPGFLAKNVRRNLNEIDLFHGFAVSKFASPCALMWGKLMERPTVLTATYHPSEYSIHRFARMMYDSAISSVLLRMFDRIIVHSDVEMKSIQSRHRDIGNDRFSKVEHTSRIANSLKESSAEDAVIADGSFLVLCVGRIDRIKRFDDVVRAVGLLRERGFDIKIAHVGPREQRMRDDSLLDKADDSLVLRLGVVSDSSLADVYKRADVTVVSSSYETFGLVAIESLLLGTPVISTKTGIMPEVIVEEVNGCLYECGDYRELADKIATLYKNKSVLASPKDSLISVERYGRPEREIDDILSIYEDLLGRS